MEFKNIDIDAIEELTPYFDMVDYEACEYCFTTMFMWQHTYKTRYHIEDDFAVIFGEFDGEVFSVLPLATKENMEKAINFAMDYFAYIKSKVYLRGINKEVVEFLQKKYGDRFDYIEERDFFDYIYDAEKLRTLVGRKNRKKRNHLNYFSNEYKGRYEMRNLSEEDFSACMDLMDKWKIQKEENNQEVEDDETIAIEKVFKNFRRFDGRVKVFGVFIDGNLEAFSIGEYMNENTALIHIEKANPEIRGLYPFINQQFLVNEFADAEFVNREEDLGIEGLRKAKMSYYPIRFAEKYTVREK